MKYVLKRQDYKQMPWKNGKGLTHEVIRVNKSDNETFLWRLSIAEIKEDGDFSIFASYQRIISVLEGGGMQLTVDGKPSRPLLRADPFAFSGNAKVMCHLLEGHLTDFNLIYDPSSVKVRLQWNTVGRIQKFLTQASHLVVFNAGSKLTLSIDNELVEINHYETFWCDATNSFKEVIMRAELLNCCVIELNTTI